MGEDTAVRDGQAAAAIARTLDEQAAAQETYDRAATRALDLEWELLEARRAQGETERALDRARAEARCTARVLGGAHAR